MVSLNELRSSSLLEGIGDEALAHVAKMAREETFETGSFLFKENEDASTVYIILEGRVAVLIDIGGGRKTNVDTVTKGETVGWSAMVPPHTMTASAKAVERTRVVAIPGGEMRDFCLTNCQMCYTIMENLARTIGARLRDTRLQLTSLMHG
jgi:CRP-like cAMP-binding protein